MVAFLLLRHVDIGFLDLVLLAHLHELRVGNELWLRMNVR